MAAANVTSIERVEDKVQQGYADMATLYKSHFESVLASGQAAIKGYQELSAELLAFTQSRMKEGLELSRRLTACGSPEAALEAQAEFVNLAMKAYGDEFSRLGDLGGKLMREAFAPLQASVEGAGATARESVAA